MSTPSYVGVLDPDGRTYRARYAHFDGAPSGPLMKACIQIRYGLPCLSCRRRQWPRTYLQISMIVLLFTHVRTVAYSSATEMAPCVVVPCG